MANASLLTLVVLQSTVFILRAVLSGSTIDVEILHEDHCGFKSFVHNYAACQVEVIASRVQDSIATNRKKASRAPASRAQDSIAWLLAPV